MHREIAEGVYLVGVDDHSTELFENQGVLPHGILYNSYLVVDEKRALIDTVKEPWADESLENIREVVDRRDRSKCMIAGQEMAPK